MNPMMARSAPDGTGLDETNTDVAAFAWVLDRIVTGPCSPRLDGEALLDVWAPLLPGETFLDALTRRAAAADIADELVLEYRRERIEGGDGR